jgi:cell division protein FtsQ
MDGRRRLAEPVADGAHAQSAAGATSARQRSLARLDRTRAGRMLRRWLSALEHNPIPRGAGVATAFAFILASIAFGTVRGGHIAEFADGARDLRDQLANAVGFRISSIALAGQKHLSREEILASAGITERTSLLFLDASDVRAQLKANPWIAEATVLKLYPGRLHIAITERDAFALWQKDGKVSVISSDGAVLEPYRDTFSSLPLVVGAGAETRAKDFLARIDQYPLLHDQMRAAVLVAERRWNVVLKNGVELLLPEEDVGHAFDLLVKLDRDDKILTRDITAIDLRLNDRVTVRLSDEAAAARAEAMKDKKAKKKGGSA